MEEDGKDGKQLDLAPKQPPHNLPRIGADAGGFGAAEQGEVLQSLDKAASVGAVPKGGPLIYKKKLVVVLSLNGILANGEQQGRAEATFNDDTAMLIEEAAAEILSPVRTSKRNAATADQNSLEKATNLKAQKKLDAAKHKGNLLANPSITSVDDFVLSDKAASLGISLGSDCKQKTSLVQSLKSEEASWMHDFSLDNSVQCLDDGDASTVYSIDDDLNLELLNNFCSEVPKCLSDGECGFSDLHSTISQIARKKPRGGKKNRKNTKSV
jgi:hypothetical protein